MEPTLESMDDYNGNESVEKRYTVYLVVGALLLMGVIYTAIKINVDSNMPEQFIPYTYEKSK